MWSEKVRGYQMGNNHLNHLFFYSVSAKQSTACKSCFNFFFLDLESECGLKDMHGVCCAFHPQRQSDNSHHNFWSIIIILDRTWWYPITLVIGVIIIFTTSSFGWGCISEIFRCLIDFFQVLLFVIEPLPESIFHLSKNIKFSIPKCLSFEFLKLLNRSNKNQKKKIALDAYILRVK